MEEVYGHCPKAFLRSSDWRPAGRLAPDAAPGSAEVTLSHLRIPGLTRDMVEQDERDALRFRYE